MASSKKFIAGGLLSGLGNAMVVDADAKREAALAELKEKYRQEERRSDREFRMGEADLRYERDLDLEDKRQEGRMGLVNARARAKLDAERDSGGLSASDQRLLKQVKERFTKGKGSLEGEVVEWDKVTERLRNTGREDLAAYVESMQGADTGIDVNSPEYMKAEEMAEEWASGQAGWFSTDKTDFADTKGNRAEAIQQKTMEYYAEFTGSGGAAGRGAGPTRDTADPQRQPQQAGNAPPGQGTRESPYRAATQGQVDWFKQNAPAGAVIEVNGQLFTKQE